MPETLFDIPLNPSVKTEDEIRLSAQCRAMLKRLLNGFLPAPTNSDFAKIALKYTGRISEIRAALEKIGYRLVAKDLGGGAYEYKVIDSNGEQQVGNKIIELLKQRSKRAIAWD